MALLELVEKASYADLAGEMLAFAAESIMDVEVETLTGAAKGARSVLRENRRKGLSRAGLRRAGRPDRAGDPEAAPGELLPQLPRASTNSRLARSAALSRATRPSSRNSGCC
jgi:hypothetical protein